MYFVFTWCALATYTANGEAARRIKKSRRSGDRDRPAVKWKGLGTTKVEKLRQTETFGWREHPVKTHVTRTGCAILSVGLKR